MNKYILPVIGIVVVVLGFIGVIYFQKGEEPTHPPLVVGLQSGYPPFEFLDKNGKIIGFDIDVANLIADKLGKTLIVKNMEFEGEILSLKQGKIDLIISGMNITPSRLKEIMMIPYHGDEATSLSLIFWKQIPPGVRTIEDIAKIPNATIAVQSGTIPEAYMKNFPNIPTKSFHGALNPLMDVKYGKSIADIVEPDVADYLKRQHPEIQVIPVPLLNDVTISGFGIGVKKENLELIEQVRDIVQELKASGALRQLEDKWFKGMNNGSIS